MLFPRLLLFFSSFFFFLAVFSLYFAVVLVVAFLPVQLADQQLADTLEELSGVRTQLEAERQQHYAAQVSVRALQQELQVSRQSHDDDTARLRRSVAEAEDTAERARQRLREEEERAKARPAEEEVEKRLEAMSAQLLKKQIQVRRWVVGDGWAGGRIGQERAWEHVWCALLRVTRDLNFTASVRLLSSRSSLSLSLSLSLCISPQSVGRLDVH